MRTQLKDDLCYLCATNKGIIIIDDLRDRPVKICDRCDKKYNNISANYRRIKEELKNMKEGN